MASNGTPAYLRLVDCGESSALSPLMDAARSRRDRQSVMRANRAAAQNPELDPTDPRWVLAARAHSQLEGSMLTPDRRLRVMRTAQVLGVRPFDASLIIAIVQDRARRGEPLHDAIATLQLVRKPATRRPARIGWRWLAAFVTAAVVNATLLWWLLAD